MNHQEIGQWIKLSNKPNKSEINAKNPYIQKEHRFIMTCLEVLTSCPYKSLSDGSYDPDDKYQLARLYLQIAGKKR